MIMLHLENIKLIQILEFLVLGYLIRKLKSIATCGEKVGNFRLKNIYKKDLENTNN